MKGRLEDKVALVSGASQGVGRATAIALAKEGASVAVTARSHVELEQLVREIETGGGHALASMGDASLEEDVERIRQETLGRFSKVDILVNNVGVAKYAPLADLSIQDYEWMMDTNMRSTFLFTKAFFFWHD